jgi:hypothetical protein
MSEVTLKLTPDEARAVYLALIHGAMRPTLEILGYADRGYAAGVVRTLGALLYHSPIETSCGHVACRDRWVGTGVPDCIEAGP